MRLNAALISRNVARVLRRGPTDLSDYAVERHQLCPAEDYTAQPALFPPGDTDRILALSPWRDWDTEQALLSGAGGVHAATQAFVVPDVVLAGGYLYRGGARERVGLGRSRMLDRKLPPRRILPEAHLVATWTGADFFGNFMQDSLPLQMLPPADAHLLGAPTRGFDHAAGYRALLDLPTPDLSDHLLIRRLIYYRDFAQNSLKERRYQILRQKLREHISAAPDSPLPPPGIFLRRGQDGERRALVNEAAIADLLAAQGFDILDPARMTAEQIARRALDARIVVGVEGSHLAHAIYSLADGGAFLVIQPPDRFALPYKEFTDRMNMRFGFVVGHPAEGGFTADPDAIRQMLDRLS